MVSWLLHKARKLAETKSFVLKKNSVMREVCRQYISRSRSILYFIFSDRIRLKWFKKYQNGLLNSLGISVTVVKNPLLHTPKWHISCPQASFQLPLSVNYTVLECEYDIPLPSLFVWGKFRKPNLTFLHQLHLKTNHGMPWFRTSGLCKTLQTRLWVTRMSFQRRQHSSNLSSWRRLCWSKGGIDENVKSVSFFTHTHPSPHLFFPEKKITYSGRETGKLEEETTGPLMLVL